MMRVIFYSFLLIFLGSPAYAWNKPVVGEGYGVQVKEGRTSDEELEMIKEAGLDYVRFVIPWYEVEKSKGSFVWGYFDRFVTRLREHGLKAVIVLGGGHPDYTGYVDAPKGNLDRVRQYLVAPATDEAVEAFTHFAVKAVEHFGDQDIVWELWNEPDTDRFWAPEANVEDYIKFASASCRAMKEANPAVRVIGPGMADFPGYRGASVPSFLGPVLQSPLIDCFDAISLHPYRDGDMPPETVLSSYDRLHQFIKNFGPKGRPTPPIVSTEWGFTLTDMSEEEQAAFLLRSFLLNSLAGVNLSIWYEWRDARSGRDDPEANFGLLKLNLDKKASYRALLDFLPPLKGAVIEKRIDAGNTEDYVLILRKPDGNYSLVYWSVAAKTGTTLLVREGRDTGSQEVKLEVMPRRLDFGPDLPSFTLLRPQSLP